jgi:hypothetical protein
MSRPIRLTPWIRRNYPAKKPLPRRYPEIWAHRDKHAPFHDTTNPKTTFDIVGLEAWYNQKDRELISMEQLRQTSSDQPQPAVTSGG